MSEIWNYFKSKGLNEYGIAGLMGNLQAESALNPKNLQNSCEKKLGMTDDTYTMAVDNKTHNFVDSCGYGLAQWTSNGRKQGLYNFCISRGCSIGDLNMQLDYLWYELSTSYKSVLEVLKNAKSIKEASDCVLTKFERPKIQNESVKAKRLSLSEEIYNKNKVVTMAKVVIGSARVNELGKYVGGQAGDQTGREVCTQDYYNSKSGWYVLRHNNPVIASALAQAMLDACYNNNIGYCQGHRSDIYDMLDKYGKLKNITEPTSADCSSLVRACLMESGIFVGNFNTGTEVGVLMKTNQFEKLTVTSSDILYVGDILVTQVKGHTAIVVQGKTRSGGSTNVSPIFMVGRTYTTTTEINVRTQPSVTSPKVGYENLTDNAKLSDKDKDGAIDAGTKVTCKEIKEVGSDIWIRIPSGWIAAYYQGKLFVL